MSCSRNTQVLGNAENKHEDGWHPCGAEAGFPFPKTKKQREGEQDARAQGFLGDQNHTSSQVMRGAGQGGAIADFVILQFGVVPVTTLKS